MSKADWPKGVRALRFAGVLNTRLFRRRLQRRNMPTMIRLSSLCSNGAFLAPLIILALGASAESSVSQERPSLRSASSDAQRRVFAQQEILRRIDAAELSLLTDSQKLAQASHSSLQERSALIEAAIPGFTPPDTLTVQSLIDAVRSYRVEQLKALSDLAFASARASKAEECDLHESAKRQLSAIESSESYATLNKDNQKGLASSAAAALAEGGDACVPLDNESANGVILDSQK